MGRLGSAGNNNSPKTNRAAAAPHPRPPPPTDDPWIAHFSHPHHLELMPLDQWLTPPICAGCNSRTSGTAYSCKPCNYVVDLSCAKMPRRIRHPAHPHSLNILAMKPAREGPSDCSACGRSSAGFMFRCDPCGYELHCQCAAKPLSVNHLAHLHALHLVFSPSYEDKVFSCDICAGEGTNHWLYRCAGCDFDAHIGCATAATLQVAASQPPSMKQQACSQPPPMTQKLRASASSPVAQEQAQQRRRARQQAASQPVTGPQQPRTRRPLAPPPQAPGWPAVHQQQGPLNSSPAPGLQRPPPQSMWQRTRQPLQQQQQEGNQGHQGPDNGGGDHQNGEEETEPDATEGGEGEDGGSGGGGNSSGHYSSHDGGDHDGSSWVQSQEDGDPESNWPNQDARGEHESNWMPSQDGGSSWMPNEDGGDCETNFMLNYSFEESDGSNFATDCSFGGSAECYAENSFQE